MRLSTGDSRPGLALEHRLPNGKLCWLYYTCTGCIVLSGCVVVYWLCGSILVVRLYWLCGCTGCVVVYWLCGCTGCVVVLVVWLYWLCGSTGCVVVYWL